MMRSDMPQQMAAPNAPAGKGYNREGFKGRGPMAARPQLPAQASPTAVTAVARRPFKKGGMAATRGNGCCAKTKSCKMY